MRRALIAAAVLLGIVSALLIPAALAADDIYFAGINDRILPLNVRTMPRYFGGALHLPYTLFSSDELGVYSTVSSNGNELLLYAASGQKTLEFDVARSTIVDQDGSQHYFSAREHGGMVYLPADFVCSFFGLTVTVIAAEPAPVVRIKTAAAALNDKTFPNIGTNKASMQQYYDAYTGQPTVSPGPSAAPSPSASPSAGPAYDQITIFLSFFDISGGRFETLLDIFDAWSYRACFFVAADEIADSAGLLRRAAGAGHTLGIRLAEGTYEEYRLASSLLFEATKIKTLLVSATGDSTAAAEETAAAKGLIFWRTTHGYDGGSRLSLTELTDRLSVKAGARESLRFSCTDNTANILRGFLSHLSRHGYRVRRITETNAPTMAVA